MPKRKQIHYWSLNDRFGKAQTIPQTKGTYALLLRLKQKLSIRIGKLGIFEFDPGYYVYFGSAFGPGGLKARVGRHQVCNKKCRWHIDYLRRKCSLVEVWYSEKSQNQECLWSGIFTNNRKVTAPVAQFGSSDCGCFSHLFYSPEKPAVIQPTP
ncbi:MAG: GIY-YIG nuclease family protein [Proteobacteria bacterium]|nr:GIY-YIG nuclease family protein [Pseudomonadota bacterium]